MTGPGADILMLEGAEAFSAFRVEGLRSAFASAAPHLASMAMQARWVYFAEIRGAVSRADLERISALLSAEPVSLSGRGFFVMPRKGTISPWSSKATDIFHNCGISCVRRVERGIHYVFTLPDRAEVDLDQLAPVLHLIHDRMTEGVYRDISDMFRVPEPAPLGVIDVMGRGRAAIEETNRRYGLALNDAEMDYLYEAFAKLGRNPTDVEVVMFGQVNSEHCRHKIFNAEWEIDGRPQDRSLFDMIRATHRLHPSGTLVAYRDNAAVIEGHECEVFESRNGSPGLYGYERDQLDIMVKVETHNHPTAISPFPGAATGVGGEIRDESATGIGGRSKAGLSAFFVSHLRVPGFAMPWEKKYADFPRRLATPLEIMIQGPIGGAGYGNEFGRPQIIGIFRTFETVHQGRYRGYHKPIMVAGGLGNIKRRHVLKKELSKGVSVVQLGGPAMRIGLGGGAASSMATGSNAPDLDFDSVQRGNAEMERRCQEVINACIAAGDANPILSIHDIGAGGLSNGCPELVAKTGARFMLRRIPNEDLSMSPMEIWCCEAQERYVLAVRNEALDRFLAICERERCPAAVIGEVTCDGRLVLEDERFRNRPIDMDIGVLLGKPPRMKRRAARIRASAEPFSASGINLREAAKRVLQFPAVSNKTFLITIADRTVTGLVARDQMVGPWQVPVADVAVTASTYTSFTGEAMAMGERTPLAVLSGPASGRMAVGEALTNMAAANVGDLGRVKLSANWMCACGEEGEDAALFDTVRAVAEELCAKLGISIPVGKDSLSMRTLWQTADGRQQKMTAPLSLIVTAFAPVKDVRRTMTPQMQEAESLLYLIDLGGGANRLGGSVLAQVYGRMGSPPPDIDDPLLVANFFGAIQELIEADALLAYHDRSDGGLFAALAEMAIAGRIGARVTLDGLGDDEMAVMFSEELGAIVQVSREKASLFEAVMERRGISRCVHLLGKPSADRCLSFFLRGKEIYRESVAALNGMWSELTWHMQALRDNPECARQEYEAACRDDLPGLEMVLTFDPAAPAPIFRERPRVAILREQGVNGHVEMAAAFHRAGFDPVDVHMTDLLNGRFDLNSCVGLAACGGFSYGDVLGAGAGWAGTILYNDRLREMFIAFFRRPETFALGVCNGCQMLSRLKDIIPGAGAWPSFSRNLSEQFEARLSQVEILPSPSVMLRGMEGSRLLVPVAHGEGRADFSRTGSMEEAIGKRLAVMRYVDGNGVAADRYPANPNGSPGGLTGFCSEDGRVTIMMPHPERAFRAVQLSWVPKTMIGRDEGPWLRMFQNARTFVAERS